MNEERGAQSSGNSIMVQQHKQKKREGSEEQALEVIALTEQGIVVPLDTAISLAAAELSAQHKLSFADAIIYSTAQQMSVPLITSDDHSEDLQEVMYFRKR